MDGFPAITQLTQDVLTVFAQCGNSVIARIAARHLKRVGDHRNFTHRRLSLANQFSSCDLRVREHLGDPAHDAVRQLGFLELIEPMLMVFFEKNVFNGFF